ncbi:hypothetical protein ACN083_06060 [Rothia sp. CCM 9418]|uniref:hypothetical protein n=1 Tax=Rothia sp. CCM 9418 TaxID=3402661 RepID=UPI003ADCD95C
MANDNSPNGLSLEEAERLDSSYVEHFMHQLQQADTINTMNQKTQELWSLVHGLEDYLKKGESSE